MAEQANLEPVHAFYDRYNAGDLDGVEALFTPDARLENCMLGQTFDGPRAIRAFFEDFGEIVEEARAEPIEVTTDGELVIVTIRLRGRLRHTGITDETLPNELVHGFELRDGKLLWYAICERRIDVLRAAGRHE